jgi:4-hydroxybenzoyl-CoA thioesterase
VTGSFGSELTVRFAHCDPAGIVFFPQYLVMVNNFVEQWFDEGLRIPYAELILQRRVGLPTVRLEADFTAISRMGEVLAQRLAVTRLGRSSLHLRHEFAAGGELRMRVRQVLVCTSLETHRPQALPDDVRQAIVPYLESSAP